MESTSLFIGYILLGASLLVSLISLWQTKYNADRLAKVMLLLAVIAFTIALLTRGIANHRVPLSSLYEFIIWFVWGLIVAFLLVSTKVKAPGFTLMTALIAFCAISYLGTLSPEAIPLMPALKSKWLVAHVATAIVSYGCFGVSCSMAILYLLKLGSVSPEEKGLIPSCTILDYFVHSLNVLGFAFQTLLLITGAVWAEEAWGTWWSWDPKETWALITWLVYAAYLHGYKSWNWKGKKGAIITIIGFAVVLFTLVGVTFLLGGLHSYG